MKLKQEKIIYPVQSSFKAVKFSVPKLEMPFHFHPEYELVYIVKGEGIRYIGESIQKFKNGDLVFIGPDLAHVWINNDQPVTETEAVVLQFPSDLLASFIEKPEFNLVADLFENARYGISFPEIIARNFLEILDDLIAEKGIKRLISLIKLLDCLSKEKNINLLNEPDFKPKRKDLDKRINAVHHYVRSFYNQKISIKDAAEIANMEQSAFCRFFKENTQKTFIQFLNETRVNQACRLLLDKNLTISQIAFNCGFFNMANFYKQFKKYTGVSPALYQK
ncbi:MAG: helix-turn-helix domain-containing protein [Calditrichaeota bacterium]|nr:MAG: helix-turn-helix domain-containing protein [Calditrichota bacterium]MBL1206650.1 helix-turn-helix domain-containing protein [Calditrichota bacterium]NOG46477.1 helix-turn-helix domain-containing protein [Calditrichota bacterium]